jgi:hypothetical protein
VVSYVVGRWLWQKKESDLEECENKIFAPLPAIFLAGLPAVPLEGLLTNLSRMKT